jgi:hypothetical protein
MQKYATRGHDDIEAASDGERAQPGERPQATAQQTNIVAKRNAELAALDELLATRSASRYKMGG